MLRWQDGRYRSDERREDSRPERVSRYCRRDGGCLLCDCLFCEGRGVKKEWDDEHQGDGSGG